MTSYLLLIEVGHAHFKRTNFSLFFCHIFIVKQFDLKIPVNFGKHMHKSLEYFDMSVITDKLILCKFMCIRLKY
jgi:hypothetical protein